MYMWAVYKQKQKWKYLNSPGCAAVKNQIESYHQANTKFNS